MNNITDMISPITNIFTPVRNLIKNKLNVNIPNWVLLLITIVIIIIILVNLNIISSPMNISTTNSMIDLNNLTGGGTETTFTLYYVEWCPHCQVVKPEWEKLENDTDLKDKINIVKINCEENEEIVKEKNIEGFPTILLTHNGKEIGYNGDREYDDFKKYLQNL